MLDGIYQVVYAGTAMEARGVFVLRQGAFTGVGQTGALYKGKYGPDPARGLFQFEGNVDFPPDTILVTGSRAGPNGLSMPFKGESAAPKPDARFSISFGGRAVDLMMSYVGPIPG